MALSVWEIGSGSVGLGLSNTMIATLTSSVAAGQLAVGWVCVQSNGNLNSISDTRGNTWTIRPAYVSGTFRYFWVDSVLTTGLEVGDTITMVCSTAANRKISVFHGISGQAANPFDHQGPGAAGTSNSPSITTSTLAQADSVILCAVYSALTAVTIEDSDYVTKVDNVIENRYMHSAARIVSSTASDTYNPTIGASQSWDVNYIVYKGAGSSPPGSVTDDRFCLFGVGN